ncbi:MAG: O-antigen ligase family protein [Planctomycetes bacterium]|nr:O-antigen ligase family protein [Planctomycetota bacterium]
MSLLRIRDPDALQPLHVVLIFIVTGTLLGGYLFLSAAESQTLVDGAVEWRVDSPLRAIVQVLCLNYQFPTIHAGAFKVFLLGLGSGLAVIALSVAFAVPPRENEDDAPALEVSGEAKDVPAADAESSNGSSPPARANALPLTTVQIVALLYLLWSFASSRWSSAPTLAVGGSVLLAIYFLWPLSLGRGLSPAAARICTYIIIVVSAVTACVAVWYYYGRNPTLRAKFPFGNPNFLAACLLPGILLTLVLICEKTRQVLSARSVKSASIVLASILAMGVGLWAMTLSGSRGPFVGLTIGFATVLFLALRGRWRALPVFATMAVVIVGTFYFVNLRNASEVAARSSTIRFRLYAWRYAGEMIAQQPFRGHGQGGFVLAGDSYAINDVLQDPQVLNARIAHAHNEWLEVFADLGLVGFALIVAIVVLTLRSGWLALRSRPPPVRWTLIGLMSALVGLCVEECFSVGLRVSGVPIAFYTILGLLWAMTHQPSDRPHIFSATNKRRGLTGAVGILTGLAIIVTVQQDFESALFSHRADVAVQEEDYEQAVALSASARSRLSPQRALTSMHRLAEAHMLTARHFQTRALDRETRAYESETVNRDLLTLADQDRGLSVAYSMNGSLTLKELVSWSPSFLGHGRIEYWLNLIKAGNAAAKKDSDGEEAEALALQNAAVAMKREMHRQPFQPQLAIEYLHVASPSMSLGASFEVLARPLRHNSMGTSYVQILARLASAPGFDAAFADELDKARKSSLIISSSGPIAVQEEIWAPELLRLAAVVHFRRGDYADARQALVLATAAYDKLAARAPIGAASCYKELADCQFYSNPDVPAPAIASGEHALNLTPDSLVGRRLRNSIDNRLVDYRLAAGEEEEARRLLASTGVPASLMNTELGLRYRNMCDALLRRRLGRVLRQAPAELVPKLKRWLDRAIELGPDDPAAHFLAADLAFHTDDQITTTAHLKRALELGLPLETGLRFLQVARQKKPDHAILEAFWDLLHRDAGDPTGDGAAGLVSPQDSTPRAP